MAINRHLNPGESVVFTTRTHPKAIVFPVLVGVVILALAIAASVFVHGYVLLAVWVIAALLILWFTGRPVLVWMAATYTVTDRRVLTRTGIFTRRGHDIPLNRISDVSYEKGVLDRMLGCGTLVISDASTQGRVSLPDVPHVEQRQLQISDLLFHGSRAAGSDADH
ncbi:MAG: PH domain-containing protein [Marmoricola sp.]